MNCIKEIFRSEAQFDKKALSNDTDINLNDEFDLARFLKAQKKDYYRFKEEILVGKKKTHCIWYMFPQVLKLKSSMTLFFFASERNTIFKNILHKYFNDKMDVRTIAYLDSIRKK